MTKKEIVLKDAREALIAKKVVLTANNLIDALGAQIVALNATIVKLKKSKDA